jgi:hypothetical protein
VALVAASVFEWVQVVAGLVAALAALGTLVFLWLTVRGTNALQRAERRAHLLDLAADYGEAGVLVLLGKERSRTIVRIAGERFRAALDSTGAHLPGCRAMLAIEWQPVAMGPAGEAKIEEAHGALAQALDELSAWLRD